MALESTRPTTLFLACALLATAPACDDLGYALAITADIDSTVDLARITRFELRVVGPKVDYIDQVQSLNGKQARRTERLEWDPSSSTTVADATISVVAEDSEGAAVATGSYAQLVTMSPGKTTYIDITLSAATSDMGTDAADASVADLAPTVPIVASNAGYKTLTWDTTQLGTTMGTWLPFNFYSSKPAPGSSVQNSDGSIALENMTTSTTAIISTATYDAANLPHKFHGVAFGGGGYFEATLSFTGVPAAPQTGPAFYATDVEHITGTLVQSFPNGRLSWADVYPLIQNKPSEMQWEIQMHNYYTDADGGTLNSTPLGLSTGIVEIPDGGVFTQSHTYAFLWTPATDASPGSMAFYCDGEPLLQHTAQWDQFKATEPYPPMNLDVGNVLDTLHIILIFGTNTSSPVTITSVRVWQASDNNNLRVP